MDFYPKLPPESQVQLKEQVLLAVQQVETEQLRHKVCEVVAEVARNFIDDDGNNQWPEFLQVSDLTLIIKTGDMVKNSLRLSNKKFFSSIKYFVKISSSKSLVAGCRF